MPVGRIAVLAQLVEEKAQPRILPQRALALQPVQGRVDCQEQSACECLDARRHCEAGAFVVAGPPPGERTANGRRKTGRHEVVSREVLGEFALGGKRVVRREAEQSLRYKSCAELKLKGLLLSQIELGSLLVGRGAEPREAVATE